MKPRFIVTRRMGLFVTSHLSLAILVTSATASTINVNLSTGQNSSGTVQSTSGAADAFWTTNGLPAKIVAPGSADWWGFWPANDANSVWIAKNPATNSGNGVGTYSRVFDLTGVNLSDVSISGEWAVDDEGSINLNGHQIATQMHDGWQSFQSHVITVDNSLSWFNPGSNTLTLTIANSDNFFEGVRFNGNLTAATLPEPATFEMLAGGAILLGAFTRLGKNLRKTPRS